MFSPAFYGILELFMGSEVFTISLWFSACLSTLTVNKCSNLLESSDVLIPSFLH
jgi:hypothetical protein